VYHLGDDDPRLIEPVEDAASADARRLGDYTLPAPFFIDTMALIDKTTARERRLYTSYSRAKCARGGVLPIQEPEPIMSSLKAFLLAVAMIASPANAFEQQIGAWTLKSDENTPIPFITLQELAFASNGKSLSVGITCARGDRAILAGPLEGGPDGRDYFLFV
jgi:hypothetical protein